MAESRVRSSFGRSSRPEQPADANGLVAFSTVRSRRLIQEIVNKINTERVALNPQSPPSFQAFLGGSLSMGVYDAPLNSISREAAPLYQFSDPSIRSAFGIARPYDTGADLEGLMKANPLGRYKFYLSLNLPDEKSNELAKSLIQDLHNACNDQNVSLGMKVEVHDYDSMIVFTFHPKEMAHILTGLYEKYPTIWLNSLHPLQGPVEGIALEHIGVVQEPLRGLDGSSHSTRMGKLGKILDEARDRSGSEDITIDEYRAACEIVGVVPERPWSISPSAAQRYLQQHAERNALRGRGVSD